MFSVSRDLVQEELVAVKQQLERWIEIFDNGRVPVEDVPTAEGNFLTFRTKLAGDLLICSNKLQGLSEVLTRDVGELAVVQPPIQHETRNIAVDLIEPNDWNPNKQDRATFDRLVEEIATLGNLVPILVVPLDTGKYRIVGGEHRWRAAQLLKHDTIPATIATTSKWQNEDLQKFMTVRLQVISGRFDRAKMLKLYQEIVDKYGADEVQKLFGYTDAKAFNRVVKQLIRSAAAALPNVKIDVAKLERETKSINDLGKVVQELFSKHGDTAMQSYIVFTYGNKVHVFIAATERTSDAIQALTSHCQRTGMEINDALAPALEAAVRSMEALPSASNAQEIAHDDGVSFLGFVPRHTRARLGLS